MKPAGDDGQPHRLFLEDRYAERLFEHLPDGVVGILDRLVTAASPQERMHHVSLNRPRANDRHLDYQVVEAGRPQSGQHAHLGPTLDLKHADRIRLLDHGVDLRVLCGDAGHQIGNRYEGGIVRLRSPLEGFDHPQTAPDRREHPQTQAVDLEDSQGVQIVLVPFDDGPAFHGGIFDRDQFAQWSLRHHHSPHMLREVTGKADDLQHQGPQLPGQPRLGIEADFAEPLGDASFVVHPAAVLRQRVDTVERQPQGLSDIADGRAGAVGDDLGGHAGPFATVLFVDVLQDLFASFVFEVDVDVGGFVPGSRLTNRSNSTSMRPGSTDVTPRQ